MTTNETPAVRLRTAWLRRALMGPIQIIAHSGAALGIVMLVRECLGFGTSLPPTSYLVAALLAILLCSSHEPTHVSHTGAPESEPAPNPWRRVSVVLRFAVEFMLGYGHLAHAHRAPVEIAAYVLFVVGDVVLIQLAWAQFATAQHLRLAGWKVAWSSALVCTLIASNAASPEAPAGQGHPDLGQPKETAQLPASPTPEAHATATPPNLAVSSHRSKSAYGQIERDFAANQVWYDQVERGLPSNHVLVHFTREELRPQAEQLAALLRARGWKVPRPELVRGRVAQLELLG